MAIKANDHPLVRDLRRLLDKHDLAGAVLVVVDKEHNGGAVSAGHTVKTCNALGPVLDRESVTLLISEAEDAIFLSGVT